MSNTATGANVDSHVRAVTDEEVEAFQGYGWAYLPGLLSTELAKELLAHLKHVTGMDYDELPPDHPDAFAFTRRLREQGIFKIFAMPRLQDELVWEYASSRALGVASARLSKHSSMRLYSDGVICKMPSWMGEQNLLTGPQAGVYTGETPWHQDYSQIPWDRRGGVQFWLALSEITPEMGSLQYLSGSHREGPLGAGIYDEQVLRDDHPELWGKYDVSPKHHLQPGDVIAHDSLIVHYAEPNMTNRMRWVYTTYRMRSDTLYTGAPTSRLTEYGIEFKQWKPFEHPKFPIVSG